MCFRLSSIWLRQYLGGAAGGRNLLGSLAAELVRPHRQRLVDVTASEHLHPLAAADDPFGRQQLRRDLGALLEALRQRIEIDDVVLLAEQVMEPALRHAPMQRHLAAFEPALALPAGARLGALVSAAGLHALAGALAAADALLRMLRALCGTQI